MPSKLEKVIAALKYLGLRPDINQYASRFIVQKIAFLAQALGMEIGYYFSIYVAGPYSRELTCDYYNEPERVNSLETNYVLTEEDNRILDKIRACCSFEEAFLMECTSTIVYFLKENPNLTDGELFEKTRLLKSYLSEYICITSLTKAKELLFEPTYLTEDLRRELEQWDEIDD